MIKASRIWVLTMIGGVDVMGQLETYGDDGESARLRDPCVIRIDQTGQLTLNPILKSNNVLTGESVDVNMRALQWISEPSQMLLTAYKQALTPIILPTTQTVGVNQ